MLRKSYLSHMVEIFLTESAVSSSMIIALHLETCRVWMEISGFSEVGSRVMVDSLRRLSSV